MKKKIMAFILAATMALGMTTTVFAATKDDNGNFTDENTITITKWYENPNAGVSPAETIEFKIERTSVTDAAYDITKENMPLPTVSDIEYEEGDAGKVVDYKLRKDITVKLPEYTSVGVYTYTINEVAGYMAGVTYYTDDIKLVVTVIQGEDGKIRVAAVHTEGENEAKTDDFKNVYEAGKLNVKKIVTGNLGDQSKNFEVTVTFTAPEGLTVGAPITYVDDGEEKTIDGDWTESKSVTIDLKHNETVTFTNIPYEVTYTVKESDYTGADGYDEAKYEGSDVTDDKKAEGTLDFSSENVNITNNKESEVDTGINLDSMIYIAILAVAAVGLVGVVARKRTAR